MVAFAGVAAAAAAVAGRRSGTAACPGRITTRFMPCPSHLFSIGPFSGCSARPLPKAGSLAPSLPSSDYVDVAVTWRAFGP